jgi:hypothetical protein
MDLFTMELNRAIRCVLAADGAQASEVWDERVRLLALAAWGVGGVASLKGLDDKEVAKRASWESMSARWKSSGWKHPLMSAWAKEWSPDNPGQNHRELHGYCEHRLWGLKINKAALAVASLGSVGAWDLAASLDWSDVDATAERARALVQHERLRLVLVDQNGPEAPHGASLRL